jgi:hypothetical protein
MFKILLVFVLIFVYGYFQILNDVIALLVMP